MRWLVPIVLVVLSLAIAGGVLAREFYQQREDGSRPEAEPSASTSPVPDEQPGSTEVELSQDARRHPHGEAVRTLLQAYTDGINDRDYELWSTTVTGGRVESTSRERWLEDYKSTRNGSIRVHRIETGPGGILRVLWSFTSTQDEADAPPEMPERCIRWRLVLPLVTEDGEWKIGPVPAGTKQLKRPC